MSSTSTQYKARLKGDDSITVFADFILSVIEFHGVGDCIVESAHLFATSELQISFILEA